MAPASVSVAWASLREVIRLPSWVNDRNDPYFIQCEFSVVGDGELIQKGKPFSKNVSDEEELVKLRRNHLRFAKTMKAINPVSIENYTAYVWNEGKNLSVFYYNTRGLADAA